MAQERAVCAVNRIVNPMRILMLTQFFHPEPSIRGLPLAKALAARGHEVQVLTGFPNYPGGNLYPGYRIRPWQREEIEGIQVNRVPLFPSHDNNSIRRIVNYASFGVSASVIGPWLVKGRPDVVLVYNLITLGIAAGILKRFKNCRIVLDVQDLWPDSVLNSGMLRNGLLGRILGHWCAREYRRPDRLLVHSPGLKAFFSDVGISQSKIDVSFNWCDEATMAIPKPDPETARKLRFFGRFNVVFAGTMGAVQSLHTVIAAAAKLANLAPDVLFTFVGTGSVLQELRTKSESTPNIQFLPRQPMDEIGKVLANADVLLVHLKDAPLFSITIPSKIQAYLFSGKALLCGMRGDGADLVEQANAGFSFQPENVNSLVDAVLKMRNLTNAERKRLGRNGKTFYQKNLSFENGVAAIESSLQNAICVHEN